MKKGDKMDVSDEATTRATSSSSSQMNFSDPVKDLLLGSPHLQKMRAAGGNFFKLQDKST